MTAECDELPKMSVHYSDDLVTLHHSANTKGGDANV